MWVVVVVYSFGKEGVFMQKSIIEVVVFISRKDFPLLVRGDNDNHGDSFKYYYENHGDSFKYYHSFLSMGR